ncbi:MAG: DUF3300 domain-containing protein [Alphaproteobacteria bacterium]|nr:DUF3300 domain-containing protein [Alphaproteobacteria bacterium]
MRLSKLILSSVKLAVRAAITAVLVLSFSPNTLRAATSQDQESADVALLSEDELFELVGPIALYPDELVAIVLPASTYPLEIVQAARYLAKHEKDASLKPDERWDSSVLGLLNYPEIINMMNEDLDWTWKLGSAVVDQQEDVMDAVQAFRNKADEAGNLESNEQVIVVHEKEIIEIRSTSTEVIYVPTYNPTTVIVYSTYPYPWVYSHPYPYYYRPAAAFWTGLFVGSAIRYGVGWRGRGRNDITVNRNVNISGNTINRGSGNQWTPGGGANRPGAGNRPGTGARPGAGAPPGAGTRPTAGSRPGASTGDRRAASTRPSSGNRAAQQPGSTRSKQQASTRRSDSSARQKPRSRSSASGSFSGYNRGQRATRDSRRGQQSRASRSNTRSSRHSRGGGRRSGGGRR